MGTLKGALDWLLSKKSYQANLFDLVKATTSLSVLAFLS